MLFDSNKKYIFLDGGMGTMLYKNGLQKGDKPDLMNITAPEAVENVHRMYIEAGSDIICTNTFGSNSINLEGTGYSPADIITAAVMIARRACSSATPPLVTTPPLVALDIGPTGQLIEPYGDLEYDTAYDLFKEMAIAGEKAGVDLATIETMSDLEELKAAMTAVKENTNLPFFATMTFDKTGRTFMGCTIEKFIELAEETGAAAVGLNCSLEPLEMMATAEQIIKTTKLPVIVKPNAGLPDEESGEYHTGAKDFAVQMKNFAKMGAKIVGGCCGTTPEYIKKLKKAYTQLIVM